MLLVFAWEGTWPSSPKRAVDFLKLEITGSCESLTGELGTALKCFERPVSSPSYRAISPALVIIAATSLWKLGNRTQINVIVYFSLSSVITEGC